MFIVLAVLFSVIILVCLIAGLVSAFTQEDMGLTIHDTQVGGFNALEKDQQFENNLIAMAHQKGLLK